MNHSTRTLGKTSPSLTLASVDAPPAALASGDPDARIARLLGLARGLVTVAADPSNGPQRRGEAHRLAVQTTRQARAILDTWTEEHAYADGGDSCSWAGTVIVDLGDAVAAVEASVRQLGELPAPAVVFTRASGIRPAPLARRAGGAQ